MKEFLHKYSDYFICLGIFLFAILWRIPYLGVRDLALDEPFTLFNSQRSISGIISLSFNGEPNPPLFLILVHIWRELFGYSEEALRVLPLLFNALTAVLIYKTGKTFFSVWAGVLALGLFLFSNYYFYFSMELRAYGLMSLATAGALYYFLALAEHTNKKRLASLLLCNVVLVYTHYFGWFLIAVEGLCALLYFSNKKLFFNYLKIIGLTFLLFLPILGAVVEQFSHSSKGTWVEPPGEKAFRYQLHALLNLGMAYWMMNFFIPIGLIAALLLGRLRSTPKAVFVCFFWWFVPLSIMYGLSFKIPMFVDRYVLFCSIGVFLFIASFIHRFSQFKPLEIMATGVLVFHMIGSFSHGKHYFKRELKSASEHIRSEQNPSTVTFLFPEWSKLNLSYHYDLEAFKEVDDLDSLLKEQGIYPVWNATEMKQIIEKTTPEKIIFFTNGGINSPEVQEVFNDLKKAAKLTSSKDFSDNVHVSVFVK